MHSSLNINRVIKSRRIKRVGCIGEKSNVYRVSGGHLKASDNSKVLNKDSGIILIQILQKHDGRPWVGYVWLRKGTRDRLLNMVMDVWVP
jgi:hypothetical protein